MSESRRTSEQPRRSQSPNENQTTSKDLSHRPSEHQTNTHASMEMSSLSSPVVTLPVLTPDRMYDASAGTYAPAIIANNEEIFYGSSDSNNNAGADIKGVHGICRHCGHPGVAKSEFCFGEGGQKHHFYFQGDIREPVEKPKRLRWIWKILLTLVLLGCYGFSIAYIIIPINKFLNQDPVTSVTITTASAEKPIPFPGIQICNSNYKNNLASFQAWFINATGGIEEIKYDLTKIEDDYGYDIECWEISNYEIKDRRHANSKRAAIFFAAEIIPYLGQPTLNSFCLELSEELCDERLPANATLYDIDPYVDSWGVSVGAFAADGKPRIHKEDDLTYLAAGGYSRVGLSYSRTFRFENPVPEEAYSMTNSRVKYSPGAYAIGYYGNYSLPMETAVFAALEFGQLSFTEINETKTYEAFNAFGDATAILGFFTGFGVFGGPAFLDLFFNHAHRPFWANMFYK